MSICIPALDERAAGERRAPLVQRPARPARSRPRSTTSRPVVSTCPEIDPCTRIAAPTNPSTRPPITSGGCRWWKTIRSITAIHSGTVAITSAARPLGIVRSPHATPALPQTNSSTATIAAARQFRRVGRSPTAIASSDRDPVEHGAGHQEPDSGREQRRQRLVDHLDREVRRAPDDVHRSASPPRSATWRARARRLTFEGESGMHRSIGAARGSPVGGLR